MWYRNTFAPTRTVTAAKQVNNDDTISIFFAVPNDDVSAIIKQNGFRTSERGVNEYIYFSYDDAAENESQRSIIECEIPKSYIENQRQSKQKTYYRSNDDKLRLNFDIEPHQIVACHAAEPPPELIVENPGRPLFTHPDLVKAGFRAFTMRMDPSEFTDKNPDGTRDTIFSGVIARAYELGLKPGEYTNENGEVIGGGFKSSFG